MEIDIRNNLSSDYSFYALKIFIVVICIIETMCFRNHIMCIVIKIVTEKNEKKKKRKTLIKKKKIYKTSRLEIQR